MEPRNLQGSVVLLAAIGMLCVSIGQTLASMPGWATAMEPGFVGTILIQIGTAFASYVAGQMLPTSPKFVKKAGDTQDAAPKE